ncbi:MAG: rRNA maturation RNase YbeY [Nitrospira sp. WS110]|nr:rRNA maturation RNase YbeY [Nitrospira sp. WS110]
MAVYLRVSLVRHTVRQSSFKHLAQRILMAIGEAKSELSVGLIGDARMRRLNREYRKQDRATDVLAFPIREAILPQGKCPATNMLGDVFISVPTAVRQAQELGRSIDVELATLLIHGVLHLCGYDHERSPREAVRMSRRERKVLEVISPVPQLIRSSPQRQRKVC